MRCLQHAFVALAAALILPHTAVAQHDGDVILVVENDQIVTGAVAGDQTIETPVRLFVGQFGNSGCPPFTSNPGYDGVPGSFEVGTKVGWSPVQPLMVWNGTTFELVDDEFVEFSFASLSFDVGATTTAGFDLFVQQNGGLHVHLDMCMNGCPDGCGLPADADPGIYLVQLTMVSTDSDLADSEPFCMLLNYQDSAENLDAAAVWADANLSCGTGTPCVGDFDASGTVGVGDLLTLLGLWGPCRDCPADLDDDGIVGTTDLLDLLALWGPCA